MDLPLEVYRQHTQPTLSHINVGTGVDCSIRELAEAISRVTGYEGALDFDTSKPDGTPRKLLDVSKLTAMGWKASIGLEEGLQGTYQWFREHGSDARS
jgi:GDP-L-fucose synthase